MKQNNSLIGKTLLATLILIMLTVILCAPCVHAQPGPAAAITANVGNTLITNAADFNTSLTLTNQTATVGYKFWVYVDVINVTDLFSYGVGFTFDNTSLNILQVQDGGFLTSNGGSGLFINSSVIDNAHGMLITVGNALSSDYSTEPSGSGHLIRVQFEVISPFSDGSPGGPVTLMHFTTNASVLDTTSLNWANATDTADITPPYPSGFYDGSFTLTVVPEFSQEFFAFLLMAATLAVALFGSVVRSRKRDN